MAILDAVLLSLVCTRFTMMSLRRGTMFLFGPWPFRSEASTAQGGEN